MTKQNQSIQDPRHDEIALLAYSIYEKRGGQPGNPMDDWLEAEAQLAGRQPSVDPKNSPLAINRDQARGEPQLEQAHIATNGGRKTAGEREYADPRDEQRPGTRGAIRTTPTNPRQSERRA